MFSFEDTLRYGIGIVFETIDLLWLIYWLGYIRFFCNGDIQSNLFCSNLYPKIEMHFFLFLINLIINIDEITCLFFLYNTCKISFFICVKKDWIGCPRVFFFSGWKSMFWGHLTRQKLNYFVLFFSMFVVCIYPNISHVLFCKTSDRLWNNCMFSMTHISF